jgi:hexulose-6-phosphate isomerase
MKKSISVWSFPAEMTIFECMALAKKAGFDGIELALAETGALSLESTDDEVLSYKKKAQELGIIISGLATGLYWGYSLTSSDSKTSEKAKSIMRKQLDFASLLSVDTILVLPGTVGVDFIPNCEIVDYDVAYDRALAAIKELAPYAEGKKVNIGIENVWNKFLLSPIELRDFIDKVGSDFVGSYLDVGNVLITGYPEQWVKILNKRIKRVHFKDYRRDVGSVAGFVDLLAGDINFPLVVEALEKIGYQSFVTAEMIPPVPFYKYYPEQLIYNTSNSMSKILKIN